MSYLQPEYYPARAGVRFFAPWPDFFEHSGDIEIFGLASAAVHGALDV